jgi:hypothetical protein
VATSKTANAIPNRQRSASVFIPALNEEKNLEPTVVRLIEALTVTIEDFWAETHCGFGEFGGWDWDFPKRRRPLSSTVSSAH